MAEKKKKAYEISELDQYLFGQGNHYEIYKKLGAHKVKKGNLEKRNIKLLQQTLVKKH